jgi:hypothetical protein
MIDLEGEALEVQARWTPIFPRINIEYGQSKTENEEHLMFGTKLYFTLHYKIMPLTFQKMTFIPLGTKWL